MKFGRKIAVAKDGIMSSVLYHSAAQYLKPLASKVLFE